MSHYENKVAVITGAGSGIGRQLAIQLAQHGARLALSDIDAAGMEETGRMCRAYRNAEVMTYAVDVSDRHAVFAHADDVRRDLGCANYVFNNAGYSIIGTIAQLTIEEIEQQLAVNLWGVIYGTKAFLPEMLQRGEGHIVNISSIFGLAGVYAQGPYNVSKFGVRGFNECLWWELEGTGVKLSSVHPGGIATNIGRTLRVCEGASDKVREMAKDLDLILKTPPEVCARDVLRGVSKGKRRILTGYGSTTFDWLTRLLPSSYFKVLMKAG